MDRGPSCSIRIAFHMLRKTLKALRLTYIVHYLRSPARFHEAIKSNRKKKLYKIEVQLHGQEVCNKQWVWKWFELIECVQKSH